MPTRSSFEYAVIRVVPRVERGEFLNAGVILFCLQHDFLGARVHLNAPRLRAVWPELDTDVVGQHLGAIPKICAGAPGAGPIAQLTRRERFHWLVAPRSTIIQMSAVHSGLCEEPGPALERLMTQFVLISGDTAESRRG